MRALNGAPSGHAGLGRGFRLEGFAAAQHAPPVSGVNRLMALSLLALATAAFGIGTSEFVPMGLLPDLSRDLGVSIPTAGMLVTAYALGVTFGAPLLAVAVARVRRKLALLLLMGVFILGNALCALAPDYTTLMLGRLLTSLCHGSFFGIGSVVAASLVPHAKRARAVSMMFTGLTLANILGVPLGTWLGQTQGWRMAFWAVVPIGLIATAALTWLLPVQPKPEPTRLLAEFAVLRRRQVLLAMSMSTLLSCTLFSLFTYIAPMLESVSGIAPEGVTHALLGFGVAITLGMLAGGRLADWRQLPSIILLFAAMAVCSALMAAAIHAPLTAVAGLMLWGAVCFAPGAALQTRVVDQAFDAPNLPATLNQSAFNLGNAIGAGAGGLGLSWGLGYTTLPWLAAGFALTGLATALTAAALDRPRLVAPAGAD